VTSWIVRSEGPYGAQNGARSGVFSGERV